MRHAFISGMRYGIFGLALWVVPCVAQTESTAPHAAPASLHHTPKHAHPRHHRRHVVTKMRLHAPPAPARQAAEAAAPLPNENLAPPQEQLQSGLNVVPGNLQLHFPPSGDGYPPASSEQTLDDTRTPKVPGVTLTVPLGQPNEGPPP